MKKILITGATGFLGQHLCKTGLLRDYKLVLGVRVENKKKLPKIGNFELAFLNYENIDVLRDQLKEISADYIIHAAGITKTYKNKEFYKINYEFTKNLVTAVQTCGCSPEKFIYISSLSSFGPGKTNPFQAIEVNDEQRPNSNYGKSKKLAEDFIRTQPASFPYIILCPTGIYGPGDQAYASYYQSIKHHIDPRMGKPQRLSFIHVQDVADFVFHIIQSPSCRKTYLLSDGKTYSDEDFSILVKKALGVKYALKIRFPFFLVKTIGALGSLFSKITHNAPLINRDKCKTLCANNWVCNSSKTFAETGFVPKFDLENGLKEFL